MSFVQRPNLSAKELAARRQNARRSTGPRSARGRARVSLNALKHGGRSRLFYKFLRDRGLNPYGFLALARRIRLPGEAMDPFFGTFFKIWLERQGLRVGGRGKFSAKPTNA